MALPNLQPDLLADEEFEEVRRFLTERAVPPDDEAAILAAVRERDWDLKLEETPDGWSVWIREVGEAEYHEIVGEERDRRRALLRGVRLALGWLTEEQWHAAFDRTSREILGIGAEEFMARWRAGELDRNDPRVVHVWMVRSGDS